MQNHNSPRIARTKAQLFKFRDETLEVSGFHLKKIPLESQNEWTISDGVLSHYSNGFFHISGLRNEVSNEEHLVLYQPQSALTGLAICKKENTVFVLVQARVEPGNIGVCQYGPTIQSTSANYNKLHGGKATSYLNLFNSFYPSSKPLGFSNQLDLGERYFLKSKSHNYVETAELIETRMNMIWAPLELLFSCVFEDNFLNTDLKSLLAIFDWEHYLLEGKSRTDQESEQSLNLESFLYKSYGNDKWSIQPIHALKNWSWSEYGVIQNGISQQNIWVDMYKTSCTNREKSDWIQPLFSCSGKGRVQLVYRENNESKEFLITLGNEFGITGGSVVLPSSCQYPGDLAGRNDYSIENKIVYSILQSEEGGRFYQNENLYQIIQQETEIEEEENQVWLSSQQLKSLLKTSNLVSIQLRCICALILNELNKNLSLLSEKSLKSTIQLN